MILTLVTREDRDESPSAMHLLGRLLAIGIAPALLAGCVQVSAPERPIEINLNINIRQEVVVRLRDDARELIESQRGVF